MKSVLDNLDRVRRLISHYSARCEADPLQLGIATMLTEDYWFVDQGIKLDPDTGEAMLHLPDVYPQYLSSPRAGIDLLLGPNAFWRLLAQRGMGFWDADLLRKSAGPNKEQLSNQTLGLLRVYEQIEHVKHLANRDE